ncbi:MAG: hypothetical protein AAF985_18705, partial [Bacteroidota bacterium]
MSREEFLQYIEYPQNLQDLNYDQLDQLLEQHPYCQNLRFLQAKKYQLDNHDEYEQKLRTVAIYMSSRTHLYQSINHVPIRVEKIDDSTLEDLFEANDTQEVVELDPPADEAHDESSPEQPGGAQQLAEPNTDQHQIEHRSAELRITESK